MTFLWPEMLWLLVLVPAVVFAYFVLLLRRKKKAALRYASLALVQRRDGRGAARCDGTCRRSCSSSRWR